MANITDLKPASLDPNAWYQVTEGRVDKVNSTKFSSMLQISGANNTVLNVWPANANQYWQFQPTGDKDGRYQVRCSKTTIEKQLSVCFTNAEVTTGHTEPCMASSNGDDSQRWDISNWGDGSFRFVNVANGTDYVLDVHQGNPPYMSSNLRTDIAQPAQHWIMTSHSVVNEADYSTVFQPATTATTTSSSSTSTAPSSGHPSSSSSSGGLSSGAAAGIGIGVGLGAVAFGLAGFFFWHRRRKNLAKKNSAELGTSTHGTPGLGASTVPTTSPGGTLQTSHTPDMQQYKYGNEFNATSHEMPGNSVPVEAPTEFHHELDSTPLQHQQYNDR